MRQKVRKSLMGAEAGAARGAERSIQSSVVCSLGSQSLATSGQRENETLASTARKEFQAYL